MVSHFRMPERKIKLLQAQKGDLLYLMIDGTEHPVQRPKKPRIARPDIRARKSATRPHINSPPTITSGFWLLVPSKPGRKHDKRIYDGRQVDKSPDAHIPGDLPHFPINLDRFNGKCWRMSADKYGYPLKASKVKPLIKEEKDCNTWHTRLRISVEHRIWCMTKFRIFF